MKLTYQDVRSAINSGELDTYLNHIITACRDRGNALNNQKMRSVKVGDSIIIGGNIRPKYMQGIKGTVKEVRRTRLLIKFDRPQGRFGSEVIVPINCVNFA